MLSMEQITVEIEPSQSDMSPASASIGCCELPASLRLSAAEADQLASMFKAIANPVRLQMVDLISRLGGQICVCDIENQFELSQPTISHHLKILRKAGIIDCERRGQWLFYLARQEALTILEQFLSGLMDEQDVVP